MEEFLKMDIFFFITTVVVIVLAVLVARVLWRFQRVMKNAEHISEQVSLESDNLREDLAGLRRDVRTGRGRIKSMFSFFGKIGKRRTKKS